MPKGMLPGRYRTRLPNCPGGQFGRKPRVFELVAAICHRHIAFKWVRVHRTLKKKTTPKGVVRRRYRTRWPICPDGTNCMELPPAGRRQADVHRTSALRRVRVLTTRNKKSRTERFRIFYLVDDIGLEPMTFRTSSGCSSQLS